METIIATAVSTLNPESRVEVTLGLRERPAGQPLLAHGTGYSCAIEPLDALAGSYQPANWESGVLSGIGYAVRHWVPTGQGLVLEELSGRLTGDGIEAVALAAAAAVAVLLRRNPPEAVSSRWAVHVAPASVHGQNGAPQPAEAERRGA